MIVRNADDKALLTTKNAAGSRTASAHLSADPTPA